MEKGRAVWEARVRRLRESDLTVAEVAAELGVNPSTLTYWKWRLGKEARESKGRVAPAGKGPTFVEVKPEGSTRAGSVERIEIMVAGGMVIRVPDAFEPETLRRVVAALASASS